MPQPDRFTLVWTDTFSRTARKFLKRHPDLVEPFTRAMKLLERDPHSPTLRLHPLTGALKGKHAIRITYAHQVVLILRITEKEIVLLDVGSHDDVYR